MQSIIMGALVEFADYLKTHPQPAVTGQGAPDDVFNAHFMAFCEAKGLDMADVDPGWALKARIDMPLSGASVEDMAEEVEIRVTARINVLACFAEAILS